MYSFDTELKTNLETVLPTYYELFLDSATATPCISYQEINDYAEAEGTTLRYSTKKYRVKLWGDDLATLTPYRASVDSTLFALGMKRTNYNELWFGNKLCMILEYSAFFKE